MRSRMGYRTLIFHLPLLQALSSKPCGGNSHIKDLGNRSANSTFIRNFIAKYHIISHDTSLAIGRISQIIKPWFSGQRMRIFNCIPYGIDIFLRSFQILIYPDTSGFSYF